jgi:hypothetical protein
MHQRLGIVVVFHSYQVLQVVVFSCQFSPTVVSRFYHLILFVSNFTNGSFSRTHAHLRISIFPTSVFNLYQILWIAVCFYIKSYQTQFSPWITFYSPQYSTVYTPQYPTVYTPQYPTVYTPQYPTVYTEMCNCGLLWSVLCVRLTEPNWELTGNLPGTVTRPLG